MTPMERRAAETGVELLPCPFCESGSVRLINASRRCGYVHCDDCGAQGPYAVSDDAIPMWNDRPSPPSSERG